MGVVRDVTIDQLTQAVQGISSTGISDSTGQAINNTLGTLGKDTSLQGIISAINALGQLLGNDKANINGDNIADKSTFRTNLGLKSILLFGTTGNSLYNNFYYGDIDLSFSSSKIFSLIITTTTNNRPAFVQILGDTKLRIWSTASATDASIKVFYYD